MKAAFASTYSWAFLISLLGCGTLTTTTTTTAYAFTPSIAIESRQRGYIQRTRTLSFSNNDQSLVILAAKKAGSFFNKVPSNDDDSDDDSDSDSDNNKEDDKGDMDYEIQDLIKSRNSPSLASEPSTINGVPISKAGVGFGAAQQPYGGDSPTAAPLPIKPFVAIGPPSPAVNDVTNPEVDDQGYTVYTNEETGEKARVFEALVDYPCKFTMKIVGANEGLFVEEMVAVVAESCRVEVDTIYHTVRCTGKWASVTVKAPVESAKMLYELYENIDKDPRVKFKF